MKLFHIFYWNIKATLLQLLSCSVTHDILRYINILTYLLTY